MEKIGHGADLLDMCDAYGYSPEDIWDFSANINIHAPLQGEEILKGFTIQSLFSYPDYRYKQLRTKLGLGYGVDPDAVIPGNGATEIIYLLCRCRPWKKIGILHPGFSEYEKAALAAGRPIKHLFYGEDFQLPEDLYTQLEGIDLLFLCNPNNPTGKLQDVQDLATYCENHAIVLVVDETFLEFSCKEEAYTLLPRIQERKGEVLVLRAMTKFHAMPGLRLGCGIGTDMLIHDLWRAKEPWTVHALAEKMVECLLDKEHRHRSKAFYQEEIAFMNEALSKIPGLRSFETATNFALLRLEKQTGAIFKERLFSKRKILIRDCGNYRGLDTHHIRINIQSRENNLFLLQALREEILS